MRSTVLAALLAVLAAGPSRALDLYTVMSDGVAQAIRVLHG